MQERSLLYAKKQNLYNIQSRSQYVHFPGFCEPKDRETAKLLWYAKAK